MRRNIFGPSSAYFFTIDGLAADTKYVLYIVLQDLADNLSELRSLDFTTA